MSLLLLLGLLGCGRVAPMDAGTVGAGVPHPADYAHGTHGVDAFATGAACTNCHASVEGTPSAGPACASCHSYPHADGFEAGAEHGAAWSAAATAEEHPCAACHGSDGGRVPAEQAAGRCGSCHSTYPHSAAWEEAGGHGAAVLQRGTDATCVGCHGPAGDAAPGQTCAACHPAYPHPDTWRADHGATALTDPKACAACHPAASTEQATTGRLACQGCHDLYPHPTDLLGRHVPLVQNRGEGACTGCHDGVDNLLAAPTLPVSCAPTCHAASSARSAP